jgi:hypothetical protein
LKEESDMPKAKEGDLYGCEECGMVVCIEDPCGCIDCELFCCDVPMTKKAGTTKKAASSKARTAPKKAKAAAKKKTARK